MTTTSAQREVRSPGTAAPHPAYGPLVGLASLGVLLQGLWAGLFVHEGKEYEQSWVHVHALGADTTIVLALLATALAVVTMRRTRRDLVVGTAAFAVVLMLEAYLGGLIGEHSSLTAVHFPLAMALMGLAVWLPLRARSRA